MINCAQEAQGVGLIAVEYGHWLGSTLMTTAGRPQKQGLLRDQLGLGELLSSRDGPTFAVGGANVAAAKRLHWTLNSLSLDLISGSLALLGEGASFNEIGKRGVWSAEKQLSARPELVRCHTIAYDLDTLASPPWMNQILSLCARRVDAGAAHAPPLQTYDFAQGYESAFRTLQRGTNTGKVVVTIPLANKVSASGASTELVTGGTAGLGLLTGRWLAQRGAANLLLVSRGGKLGSDPTGEFKLLSASGAKASLEPCDVAQPAHTGRLLARLHASGRELNGVWHAAGVLADGTIQQLRPGDGRRSHEHLRPGRVRGRRRGSSPGLMVSGKAKCGQDQ